MFKIERAQVSIRRHLFFAVVVLVAAQRKHACDAAKQYRIFPYLCV